MTWRLPEHQHRTFSRNPLVAVIAQLRFDPILKIQATVAEFQDKVRGRFPRYEQTEGQAIELAPGGMRVRKVADFRFSAKTEPTTVVLGDQGLAIEYRAHQHRDVLFTDFELVANALDQVYRPISPTRLGLRYVNVIDRARVSRDLQRPVEWSELVAEAFLHMPADLADLEGTRFAFEVSSPVPSGAMTLKYGLLPAEDGALAFRLDVDRYREDDLGVAGLVNDLRTFSDDIFRVFASASGPALCTWMEGI
jgi:uncharacterized protein (TIGR04255 family)